MSNRHTSEDFFKSAGSRPPAQKAELKSRKARPPPPPPPAAGSSSAAPAAAASSYYGNVNRPSTRAAPPAQQASVASTSSRPPAPSYYGSSGGFPSAASSRPAASTAASTSAGGTSYYGAPAPAPTVPAPAPFVPATTSASTATATTAATSSTMSSTDGWYSAPAAAAPAPSNDGWYSGAQAGQQATTASAPSYTSNFGAPQQQQSTSGNSLEGAMDATGASKPQPSIMQPSIMQPMKPATMQSMNVEDFENEPPLLEELGIHMDHILVKTRAVVLPFSRFTGQTHVEDVLHEDSDDLAGPLAFALLLGGELLLSGKLQFGYIYGFGLFGCLAMTLVLNLLSRTDAVNVWTVTSILGYALLPVNVLALIKIVVVNLIKLEALGRVLAILTISWSTIASTRLLEQKCDMRDQRYLIGYPIALLYSAFVMITIF